MDENKIVEYSLGDMLPAVITIAVAVVGTALTLELLGDTQSDMTADTAEYNATGEGITGLAKFTGKIGIIVTIFVMSIVLFMLMRLAVIRFR